MLFGRVTRIAVDIVGTFVVLLLLGAGILSWRLSEGPISLEFLTPLIVRALSQDDTVVTVKDTVLAWGGWEHNFDIRILGVRMLSRDGRPLLEVPEVSVGLSPSALLLHGLIAPTSLDAFGAQLTLVRSSDGTWHFRGPGTGGPSGEAPSGVPVIFQQLLAPPNPDSSLGYLLSASILNSSVTLIDEPSGHTFVASDAQLLVRRDHVGLRAELSAAVDLAGKPASVSSIGHYVVASRTLDFGLNFAKLDPVALAAAAPELSALSGLNVPLSGRINLEFDPQFRLAQAGFSLTGENGNLAASVYGLPADAPVRRLRLEGRMPKGLTAVEISEASIDFGGPTISLHAALTDIDAHPQASAAVVARNVSAEDLRRLWPLAAARNARAWITENILRANITEARLNVSAGASALGAPWDVEQAEGTFSVKDAEVNYLTPMPHLQGVDGEGKFNRSRVDITTSGGGVGNLRLGNASIALTALDTNNETAEIDAPITGPLQDALVLVDGPPLGYLQKVGLSPADFSGDMALRLQLKLPMKKDLKTDEIDVQATAQVHNLTQRKAALGQDVTDGDVELRVTKDSMNLAGRVKLGPIPAEVELVRNFSSTAPVVSRTRARARVANAADFAALGMDVSSYINGPTTIAVEYVERSGRRNDVTLDATLDDAAMSFEQFDWRKGPGKPATVHVAVNLVGARAAGTEFSIAAGNPAAGGMIARGRATYAPDGRSFNRVEVDTLKVGLTDLHGVITRSDEGTSIALAGPSFYAAPFLKSDTTTPSSFLRPPLNVDIQIGRLYLATDRWLSRFRFRGRRGSTQWLTADLETDTSDDPNARGHAALTLQMFPDGHQTLDMIAGDAGAFMRASGITSNVVGGRLEVHGATDLARAEQPIDGYLHMTPYRVVGAPILAKVLSVALLTGIVDSLSGQGIGFDQLDAKFAYFGSRIEVTDARSAGSAIGVTANGTIDLDGDAIDLSGTIVPANAINSLPSKIPVIGNLLTGGGRGLFAATYKISGPMSDPKVSVNPLSALAPGFLRGLFGNLPGTSPTDATPQSEKDIETQQPKPPAPPASPATPP